MTVTRPNPGRRWVVLAAVLVIAMPLGACAPGSPPSASPQRGTDSPTSAGPSEPTASSPSGDVTVVTIRDLSYGEPEITVAVGSVTFVNEDDVEHTVTEGENGAAAPTGRFDVFVDIDDSAVVPFSEPGDYRITCQFHPEMHLIVHAH